jgi:hypothetical protein
MKDRLLHGWTFQRSLYLAMGITIIIQSIISKQIMGTILGIYFALMGLFAFGCASGNCFGGNCEPLPMKKSDKKIEDVTFEEIK